MDSSRLNPRESGKFIASKAKKVSILEDGVIKTARLVGLVRFLKKTFNGFTHLHTHLNEP